MTATRTAEANTEDESVLDHVEEPAERLSWTRLGGLFAALALLALWALQAGRRGRFAALTVLVLASSPVAFVLLVLTLVFIARFRRSKLGTSALMVQMNPALAASLGVDPRKVRLAVFVISAPITGLAGWLYAYQRAYVGPDMFESYFLVLMLTAIVIVGRRLLLGGDEGHALVQSAAQAIAIPIDALTRRSRNSTRCEINVSAAPDSNGSLM